MTHDPKDRTSDRPDRPKGWLPDDDLYPWGRPLMHAVGPVITVASMVVGAYALGISVSGQVVVGGLTLTGWVVVATLEPDRLLDWESNLYSVVGFFLVACFFPLVGLIAMSPTTDDRVSAVAAEVFGGLATGLAIALGLVVFRTLHKEEP